ncbi:MULTISPECIES: ABC transporter permease [Kocuria]|uniref:ABC transporter permease n=1 Tax=Kocuria TaxID=57493 RepID=UPI00075044DE|nr:MULTISPECIES: ABC transporter permease [Kocuria]WIW68049.1 ABC transporter permease [Kocuria sp. ChxB]KUP28301.1 ABC transporter permease [Kocuria rhizophila]MCT1546502.1 ABC transporter permease [Kocuria rhizophila]MCT2172363.1 ABC transporter permease [Kocuria rhizophila]MDA4828991.1 ABC transporter permease [Kocuria rhizophila]
MSTATASPHLDGPDGSVPEADLPTSAVLRDVGVRTLRPAVGLAVLALVALVVFALNASGQSVQFRFSGENDAVRLPDVSVASTLCGWVVTAVLAVLAGYAAVRARALPRWASLVAGFFFVTGFLVWIVGTAQTPSISVTALLAGSVALATPLVFGSLGGLLCERSGVVNIAIEAQLLFGAFSAAVVATIAGSAWAGLLAAVLGSVLVSVVLAVFAIRYRVNQVIVGVVLNVLVSGLTGFLFATVLEPNAAAFNSPERLPHVRIPVLAEIPVVGPVLFDQSVIGYIMYATVAVVWFALYRTRWGLRTRAVGEHPKAADTLGIPVNALRVRNVLLGGAVAGLGGAFYTLVSVSAFTRDMTAGSGYIALAALIFGRWNPVGALLASLLFGFASNLESILSFLGTPVPSQFLAMLPYVVTILAVAGLVGRSRGPAASGEPYLKE